MYNTCENGCMYCVVINVMFGVVALLYDRYRVLCYAVSYQAGKQVKFNGYVVQLGVNLGTIGQFVQNKPAVVE